MPLLDPTDRVALFTQRMRELCAEADLPEFDHAVHETTPEERLGFIWEHPEFCVVVSPENSSIFGMDAGDLLRTWHRKHGGDWRARLERGAIRRRPTRGLS